MSITLIARSAWPDCCFARPAPRAARTNTRGELAKDGAPLPCLESWPTGSRRRMVARSLSDMDALPRLRHAPREPRGARSWFSRSGQNQPGLRSPFTSALQLFEPARYNPQALDLKHKSELGHALEGRDEELQAPRENTCPERGEA
jgi:hypothetical protein